LSLQKTTKKGQTANIGHKSSLPPFWNVKFHALFWSFSGQKIGGQWICALKSCKPLFRKKRFPFLLLRREFFGDKWVVVLEEGRNYLGRAILGRKSLIFKRK
jgi:hypothetical protein